VAPDKGRTDVGKELVHHVAVLDHAGDLTARVQVTTLGEGHHPLSQWLYLLGLGQRGLHPAVAKQLGGQIAHDAVVMGRRAAEVRPFLGLGHGGSSPGSPRGSGRRRGLRRGALVQRS
jgi:hypothetical protein